MARRTSRNKAAKKPGPKKGVLRTPPALQAAVVAAKMAGGKTASNVKIAEMMGLDRNTVTRILSQAEIREAIQKARSGAIQLLPDCHAVIAEAVRVKREVDAAFKVYDGMQVFVPKSQQDTNMRVDDPLLTRPRHELDYYARTGFWPTEEETAYYQAHQKWPEGGDA